jgi:hypothetical protein
MWRSVRLRLHNYNNQAGLVTFAENARLAIEDILVSFGHRRYVDALVLLFDPRRILRIAERYAPIGRHGRLTAERGEQGTRYGFSNATGGTRRGH